jgi:hypothetical protein
VHISDPEYEIDKGKSVDALFIDIILELIELLVIVPVMCLYYHFEIAAHLCNPKSPNNMPFSVIYTQRSITFNTMTVKLIPLFELTLNVVVIPLAIAVNKVPTLLTLMMNKFDQDYRPFII